MIKVFRLILFRRKEKAVLGTTSIGVDMVATNLRIVVHPPDDTLRLKRVICAAPTWLKMIDEAKHDVDWAWAILAFPLVAQMPPIVLPPDSDVALAEPDHKQRDIGDGDHQKR